MARARPAAAEAAGRCARATAGHTGSAGESGSRKGAGSGSAACPESARGRPRASSPAWGSTSTGPTCTGAPGRRTPSLVDAVSTIRPAYITAMSSAISATTPRSCVMITIAIPSSRCRRSSSARICACTVTSSAVVGSSAISSFGSLASAIAIIARWRMPPENSCGKSSTRRDGSGMPTSPSSSIARSRACALETSWCARTASIS